MIKCESIVIDEKEMKIRKILLKLVYMYTSNSEIYKGNNVGGFRISSRWWLMTRNLC